jgi:hypothetical protein
MTVAAQRARRWPNALGAALPPLLAMALVVPVAVLFLQSRQTTDEDRSFALKERHGAEYLQSLGQVTIALADAQSAAVTGRAAPPEALTRAVEATSAIDTRLGGELRSRERWASLRAKIEALRGSSPTGADPAFAAYSEVTDLLLALNGKVRETSGLARDPAADSYHLQDSATEELPEALVAMGRLADLAALAPTRRAADRVRTIADLSAARAAVASPAGDLVEDLLAAVERTESRSLGSKLLGQLDGYQRSVEALAAASALTPPATAPTGTTGTEQTDPPRGTTGKPGTPEKATTDSGVTVNAAGIAAARLSAQASATELSKIIYSELDELLAARVDDLDGQRRLALGATGLAVLLILALAAGSIARTRRRTPHRPGPDGSPLPQVGPARWDSPGPWSLPIPDGPNNRPGQPTVNGPELQPAHWGRSDAAR